MARMRPVSHEDQLSLVEHLDELRTRIVVCLVVVGVALALCFWQNHLLLEIASGPLPSDHKKLLTFGVAQILQGLLQMKFGSSGEIYAPPPLLKRMVLAGWNGRKTGRGFYDYRDPQKPVAQEL